MLQHNVLNMDIFANNFGILTYNTFDAFEPAAQTNNAIGSLCEML